MSRKFKNFRDLGNLPAADGRKIKKESFIVAVTFIRFRRIPPNFYTNKKVCARSSTSAALPSLQSTRTLWMQASIIFTSRR